LAAAGVAVVVCPVSYLCLQGRSCDARGLAPIRWLRDAGVSIGIGLDNIRDVVVSVGTADPLRAAWLVAVAEHLTGEDDLEWLGRAVTAGNRRICSLPEDVEEAGTDELLVIEAVSLAKAVALVPPRQRLVG
jgi:cytosine/adenosine deaminase-related metal-dependent hydrolase